MDRLNREGRLDAFFKRRSELYHSDDWSLHWDNTWWPVAREFGFISKADEVMRFEHFMLHGNKTLMQKQMDQMKEEIEEERITEDIELLTGGDDLELPPDIKWVYTHPAMARPPKDGEVHLTRKDFVGAPSRGAVGMLKHFVGDKREFYKTVLSLMIKKDVAATDDKVSAESEKTAKEIQAMLDDL